MRKTKLGKKHKYMITVLVLGLLFSVLIFVTDKRKMRLQNGNELIRNEYGEGDYEIGLNVLSQDISNEINLVVKERDYSEEELDTLSLSAYEAIGEYILGRNVSLTEIRDDMVFPLSIKGYPFDLRWSVSDEKVMDRSGHIKCEEGCMQTHEIIASVVLMHGDFRQVFNYKLRIVPRQYSFTERAVIRIKEEINEALVLSTESSIIKLPGEYEGTPITYSERISRNGVLMLLVSFLLSAVIGICVDFDEKRKNQKMREELERSYSTFAEMLKLYLISGLTLKNAFFEIRKAAEFSDELRRKTLARQIAVVCNKYANGCTEETIINDFGAACEGSYRKLSFLLSVNLKRGNNRLIELMEEEVAKANSNRKETAGKKGDEASIKLLFPMMVMMLIVMALIILPAYLDFG